MSAAANLPETTSHGSLSEQAAAVAASLDRLNTAAANAAELLRLAGVAGMRGDTADDLSTALAIHGHLVHQFNVTVRTSAGAASYCTRSVNAAAAAEAALDDHGDTPCGITVTAANPDDPALAAAYVALRVAGPLDKALKDPSIGRAIRSYARKHPVRRPPITDFKSLAANDRD
ncbi:hypothetical protein [Pseudoduganella sp. R-43]|uniref:hypothetical protein n=1 Tax=Pseudoduganella sp. R-43 TaxID=3404063 RepID=UPI003CF0B33E